jgi:hypothetical protein
MKNGRKILTARQLANSPPALAHTEINRKKMGRRPKLVIDRSGWPDDGERLTGTWGAQVAITALRRGQPELAARHLRDDNAPSRHVRCLLADMMHPGPECRELVRFKSMHRKVGSPKLVCDRSEWPGPEGEWTAVEALRCGKLELAARLLRDKKASLSEPFRLLLADMIDPHSECGEPFRLEIVRKRGNSFPAHRDLRLKMIGQQALRLYKGWAKWEAVLTIMEDLGVCEGDMWKGVRLVKRLRRPRAA